MLPMLKNTLIGLCLVVGISGCGRSGLNGEIEEREVHALLDASDKAINELNADELLGFMSDDVDIVMNTDVDGEVHAVHLSKKEYGDMLEQSWALFEKYQYHRENTVIQIDGTTATISSDLYESMIMQGQKASAQTSEITNVEKIGGVLKVTKLEATPSL